MAHSVRGENEAKDLNYVAGREYYPRLSRWRAQRRLLRTFRLGTSERRAVRKGNSVTPGESGLSARARSRSALLLPPAGPVQCARSVPRGRIVNCNCSRRLRPRPCSSSERSNRHASSVSAMPCALGWKRPFLRGCGGSPCARVAIVAWPKCTCRKSSLPPRSTACGCTRMHKECRVASPGSRTWLG